MAPTPQPPWTPAVIESIADVLGATEWPGLSGDQIGQLLAQVRIDDPYPSITKRKRLAAALQNRQAHDRHSNRLVTFLTSAMDPARYVRDPAAFDALRQDLSEVLSLAGLKISDKGKVAYAPRARTLDEVAALAGRLQAELTRRGVHPQAIHYCREELLRRSTFHAVFEATKGLAERLRQMTGMTTIDGDELVTACFAGKTAAPVVQINAYRTKSEISEHNGFANLVRGVLGTFRNPTAHAPRTAWIVPEADALDLFSTLSYLHRRLDGATVTR